MLTNDDVKKFQKIYREKFGEDISHDDAFQQGLDLLNLMRLLG